MRRNSLTSRERRGLLAVVGAALLITGAAYILRRQNIVTETTATEKSVDVRTVLKQKEQTDSTCKLQSVESERYKKEQKENTYKRRKKKASGKRSAPPAPPRDPLEPIPSE